ncbi:MAG: hypothetical protein HQL88_04050 [Magnetococcales bacterium]|nr:hypothetical protein [Magnetococcales bacterium]
MLNSVSVGAIYGIANPLQGHLDLNRVHAQILTQDFEQIHLRSVTGAAGQGGSAAVESTLERAERGMIRESLRYRPERPLVTVVLEKISPAQAAARFRQVQGWLEGVAAARQAAHSQTTLSLYA